jgi:hypothetical protein
MIMTQENWSVNGHQPVNGSSPWAEQPQLARPEPERQRDDVDFYTAEITAVQVWAVNSLYGSSIPRESA